MYHMTNMRRPGGNDEANRVFVPPIGQFRNRRHWQHGDCRIVGVIRPWGPMPRFYDLFSNTWSEGEQFFISFTTAIDRHIAVNWEPRG
jgi:hypothetical protein